MSVLWAYTDYDPSSEASCRGIMNAETCRGKIGKTLINSTSSLMHLMVILQRQNVSCLHSKRHCSTNLKMPHKLNYEQDVRNMLPSRRLPKIHCIRGNTERFIMFSVITNIYNTKTKEPTLMELFTATEKPKKNFLTTKDVRCVHHGTLKYRIDVCRVTRGAHIAHL
jgi:hypothetical protein